MPRPVAEAGNGDDISFVGEDHDWRHPRDVHFVGMQDGRRNASGAARIDGVAIREAALAALMTFADR